MKNRAMYNSFHTALSGGSGRIEDACGESPAASYFGLLSLGEFQIIRSLFVHYSLFICDHSLIMQTKPSKSDVPVSWGDFGVSWEHLGGSCGDLGGSWEGLGRSWGHLGGTLGWSWGLLGRLGRSWDHLGVILGYLGAILNFFE